MPERVELSKIDPGARSREEYGDLEDLGDSIQEFGVLQPIRLVEKSEIEDFDQFEEPESGFNDEKPYLLIAGGRRYFATLIETDKDTIPYTVDNNNPNEVSYREQELEENVQRKDLSWKEKNELIQEIHRLKTEKYGKKSRGSQDEEGWSQEKTGELTGMSKQAVGQHLNLAEDLEKFPEVKEEASSMNQAKNMVRNKKKQEERKKKKQEIEEKKKKGEEEKEKEKICDRYIQGDFFQIAEQLPNERFDIVELDPPYGIDFDEHIDGSFGRTPSVSRYEDIPREELDDFMSEACGRAFELLKEDGWLIFWFSSQHTKRSKMWLESAGFTLPNVPAVWNSRSGRCRNPKYTLAHDSEFFWYARKGSPEVTEQGRSNIFTYRRVEHADRYHDSQAPVKLYEEIFNTFGEPNQRALSGFCGSGAVILGGYNAGIDTLGIDLDPNDDYKSGFVEKVWDGDLGSFE